MGQFSVADYGAVPDSQADSGPAIRAAIAAAMDSGEPAEVVLDEGAYRVSGEPGAAYVLPVRGARDLTIRGGGLGTEIIITNPELGCFSLSDCERTTIAGLTIDYDPPPFSQGTVTTVDLEAETFDLALDEGCLPPDHPAFDSAKATWGLVVRPGTQEQPARFGPTAIPTVVEPRLESGQWRLKIGGEPTGYSDPLRGSGMVPGDRFVRCARNYAAAVWADHSDDVLVEGVTLHASSGLAFCPYLCGRVTIRDCHVGRRPGSGRMLSTNADGVHCRGSREGIAIEGCSFEGMSDDAINIHASPIPVLEVISPTELIVQKFHYTLRVGDRLEGMHSAEARIRGQATVTTIEELPDRWAYRIELDAPIEGLQAGEGFDDADNLYNLSECATGSVVTGCRFGSFRGRGIVLSCAGATISDNRFDVMEGWGVSLYHEATRWAEGPLARDIRIIGNTFNGHGGYQAAIGSYPFRREGGISEARAIHNVLIQGNRFTDLGVPAVELRSCRNVKVLDNTIETSLEAPRARPNYASVTVDNCAGVVVSGLTVTDRDPRHIAAVQVSPNTEPGTVGVEITNMAVDLAPDSVVLRDERGE